MTTEQPRLNCAACGFDLREEAEEEVTTARRGQGRIHVTCPACESISAFTVEWTATVLPESALAVKVQKA
jgi:RNase P subunit RPR2